MHITSADVTPESVERERVLADFVAQHYQRLFRLAMLICADPSEASDAVQHGLERAWRKRADLRDEASLRSWLDRIVVNEAIRQSRRRQSWLGRLLPPSSSVGWIEPVDERATELPVWTALRAAFEKLSPDQRAVIALHLHAGYTVAETAELVGAPVESVRSRLRRAKERLRTELGDES